MSNKYFKRLGQIRETLPDMSSVLSSLLTLPIVLKKKGEEAPDSGTPHWMEYENHKTTSSPSHVDTKRGRIMVTRHTDQLGGAVRECLVTGMKALIQSVPLYDWKLENLHFMFTEGDVLPHRGGTRNVSINLGLMNSNVAVTEFGADLLSWSTPQQLDRFIQQDGDIMLLDVTKWHAVKAFNNIGRYQLTYFTAEETFDSILSNCR